MLCLVQGAAWGDAKQHKSFPPRFVWMVSQAFNCRVSRGLFQYHQGHQDHFGLEWDKNKRLPSQRKPNWCCFLPSSTFQRGFSPSPCKPYQLDFWGVGLNYSLDAKERVLNFYCSWRREADKIRIETTWAPFTLGSRVSSVYTITNHSIYSFCMCSSWKLDRTSRFHRSVQLIRSPIGKSPSIVAIHT